MKEHAPQEITQLLLAWNGGDATALDRLMPLVHDALHQLAHQRMSRARPGHPLQTTALVNEAYLRLVDARRVGWQNRAHFFAVSAQLMRHILVDVARATKEAQTRRRHHSGFVGRGTRGVERAER